MIFVSNYELNGMWPQIQNLVLVSDEHYEWKSRLWIKFKIAEMQTKRCIQSNEWLHPIQTSAKFAQSPFFESFDMETSKFFFRLRQKNGKDN